MRNDLRLLELRTVIQQLNSHKKLRRELVMLSEITSRRESLLAELNSHFILPVYLSGSRYSGSCTSQMLLALRRLVIGSKNHHQQLDECMQPIFSWLP